MVISTSDDTRSFTRDIVNGFGTLGYLSLIFQWGWTTLLLTYPLIESGHVTLFPEHQAPSTPPPSFGGFTFVMAGIAFFVSTLIIILAVIAIVRLPKTVGQQGAKLTHITANAVIPIVAHHKPIAEKKKRILSYRLVIATKGAATILPLLGILCVSHSTPIDTQIVWIIAWFTACCSTTWFLLQYCVARLRRLRLDTLW